jgi:hypothetical protein
MSTKELKPSADDLEAFISGVREMTDDHIQVWIRKKRGTISNGVNDLEGYLKGLFALVKTAAADRRHQQLDAAKILYELNKVPFSERYGGLGRHDAHHYMHQPSKISGRLKRKRGASDPELSPREIVSKYCQLSTALDDVYEVTKENPKILDGADSLESLLDHLRGLNADEDTTNKTITAAATAYEILEEAMPESEAHRDPPWSLDEMRRYMRKGSAVLVSDWTIVPTASMEGMSFSELSEDQAAREIHHWRCLQAFRRSMFEQLLEPETLNPQSSMGSRKTDL